MNNIDLSQLFDFDKLLLTSQFSVWQILLSLLITLVMSLYIFWVYKKTYNGVLYSKNFNITLVMTAIIVNALMIGISGNIILSLGMVGALSIVRFRTAVKDPKDTAFLFWVITVGVINGVAYYSLSVLFTVLISLILFFMSRVAYIESSYMLIVKYRGDCYSQIEDAIKNNTKRYFVRSDSHKKDLTEKVIEVSFGKKQQEKILEKIRNISEVDDCVLLASNGEFSE